MLYIITSDYYLSYSSSFQNCALLFFRSDIQNSSVFCSPWFLDYFLIESAAVIFNNVSQFLFVTIWCILSRTPVSIVLRTFIFLLASIIVFTSSMLLCRISSVIFLLVTCNRWFLKLSFSIEQTLDIMSRWNSFSDWLVHKNKNEQFGLNPSGTYIS